uniref:ATP synthase mitochondrial F1 complex assembly factor 1 n=3 Tax=Equus TaxID=9789 RepID=F6XIV8_HORSE
MVKDKTAEEIKQIWQQYFAAKDTVYAVIPEEKFDLIWNRAQSCPTFLCALPRREGYEFFVGQWTGAELHFTALINIQTRGEAAASQLILYHYPELKEEKGIVLMTAEMDSTFLQGIHRSCPWTLGPRPSLAMALCLKQVFAKDKTFRPRKRFEPGTQRFELYKKAQASLKSGLDLRSVVRLPPGENIDDWIAVHVVDFFNRINLIYGTMAERCSETSCPVMAGGPRYEYRWQDERQYRRPAKLSAPRYMALLMDWIEGLINDEDVFPTRIGVPFPRNFQQVCTKILTRLFRVFVHVYIHHFDSILSMGAEAHVNTCYKHFYYFIREFSLVDQRELEPLREMTERICH